VPQVAPSAEEAISSSPDSQAPIPIIEGRRSSVPTAELSEPRTITSQSGPSATADPPVVEIRIGSVEIHSTPSPATSPAKAGPLPTSLDAFLAQARRP
jgi:hypothetical protein